MVIIDRITQLRIEKFMFNRVFIVKKDDNIGGE
jgi:hypothetical protein